MARRVMGTKRKKRKDVKKGGGATWEIGAAWGKERIYGEKEDEMGKGEMRKRRIMWRKKGEDKKKRGISCENRDKEGNLGEKEGRGFT
jgi:hypothetical protein